METADYRATHDRFSHRTRDRRQPGPRPRARRRACRRHGPGGPRPADGPRPRPGRGGRGAMAALADELGAVDIVFSNATARMSPEADPADAVDAVAETSNLATTR